MATLLFDLEAGEGPRRVDLKRLLYFAMVLVNPKSADSPKGSG
jgi:hypothetical protein